MADIFEKLLKDQGPLGQHRERAHGYCFFGSRLFPRSRCPFPEGSVEQKGIGFRGM